MAGLHDIAPTVAVTVEWLNAGGAVVAMADQIADGSGGPAVRVFVFDATGVAGTGEQMAGALGGPFRGEALGQGVCEGSPDEVTAAGEGVDRTVVYYDGSFDEPTPAATSPGGVARWCGRAARQ